MEYVLEDCFDVSNQIPTLQMIYGSVREEGDGTNIKADALFD